MEQQPHQGCDLKDPLFSSIACVSANYDANKNPDEKTLRDINHFFAVITFKMICDYLMYINF